MQKLPETQKKGIQTVRLQFFGFGQLLNRHSRAGGNIGLSARELIRRHSRESGNPDSSVQKL
ncbi:hypothetical protein, partial [Neisseria meningitidis]|uniref:hypothetical protein n=1 Tax=Neisseria meningitidis TaxID=487 RepID=UPI001C5A2BE6